MQIDHTFAHSTNIKRVQYESPDLFITFKQGRRYKYSGVPQDVAEGFVNSDSAGKYYFANIQGKYPYEEVK